MSGQRAAVRSQTSTAEDQQVREQYSAGIVESVRAPLLLLDDQFHIVSANLAFYEIFGTAPDATIDQLIFSLGDGQWNTPELNRRLDILVRTGQSFRDYDIGLTFPGLGRRIIRLNAQTLARPKEHVPGSSIRTGTLLLAIEDVTVSRPASDAMSQSESRYRRLFEAARDGILLLDSESGVITDANPSIADLLGYTCDELIGRELWAIGLFADREASRAAFRVLQESGYIRYENLPLQTHRGERREVEFVSNVYSEGDHVVIQCNIRDITERKQWENSLRQSETRYRRLFEEAQDGVAVLDIDTGRITDGNRRLMELLGCSREELIGKELWQIGLLADKQITEATFELLLKTGYIRYDDLPLLTRSGERRQIKFTSNVYTEGDRRVIQCNVCDITERKRMENALAVVMAREHHIAETLQRPLIVQVPEDAFPGLLISTLYAPASSEALIGGDFHDAFSLPGGRVALAVADTLGKGLFAAARTMQIKDVLRAFARESSASLTEVVERVNRFACNTHRFEDSDDGMFTCLVLVFLDTSTGEAEAVFAGCEPPVLLCANGDAEYIPLSHACLPVGIMATTEYPSVAFRLDPGDTLILMTDGITEAHPRLAKGKFDNAFLETAGATELARRVQPSGSLRAMGAAILEGARAFAGGELHDDACLLLARLRDG